MALKHVSRRWKATDTGSVENTQYGSYKVGLERAGGWKIAYLKHDFLWSDGNSALFDMRVPSLVSAMERVFSAENLAAAANDRPTTVAPGA